MTQMRADRFKWQLSFYAVAGAVGLFLVIATTPRNYDVGELLYLFVVAPIVTLSLLIVTMVSGVRGKPLHALSVLSMLVVYGAVSWALVKNYQGVRAATRWFLWSKNYKAEVLAHPSSADGELRHIEWDGWGFPGAGDTVMYLLFDPSDSLHAVAKDRSAGKFSGIPCEVPRVHRLESRWYYVVFYTDMNWDRCS